MKKALGICAALFVCFPLAAAANMDLGSGFPFSGLDSFVQEIISKTVATSSSGTVVSGSAVVTGDSSASANVRNIISSGNLPGRGSNTNVRVDIRTEVDGTAYATSVSRTVSSGERVDVRVGSGKGSVSAQTNISTDVATSTVSDSTTTPSRLMTLFDGFRATLSRMVDLVFFFW